MTIRVLLADDQPLVRTGIAMLLTAEPDIQVAGEAGDGDQAIALARSAQPDVVLMDVRMPRTDGVEATRRITADGFSDSHDRPLKVLMLTTYHIDEAVYAALRAGASGFLLKDAAPTELVAAVRAVATGDAWLHPAVARGLLAEFAARPEAKLPAPAELARLTTREREVLALVAQGLSNMEIAAEIFVGEATVKTHFGRILMKLGLRDRAQAVATAYQCGLVQPPPRQ
ncbi:response regulator [Phytohabitans houttuyneae]|uniref:DNA-binding response regulator n=1 Tax=Phytohabitans houttuyneae TaxID=1076126 RepID=A0A6V8JYR3_9ACTN|nr:response regulator transcription factor [Phytohabitans houttuyneae]GFJ76414.1 DNA-binding response regulator [Phytohabitans houttuyneae]